jgi:hypothetical protein
MQAASVPFVFSHCQLASQGRTHLVRSKGSASPVCDAHSPGPDGRCMTPPGPDGQNTLTGGRRGIIPYYSGMVQYGMPYGAPPTPWAATVATRWCQLERAPTEHAQTAESVPSALVRRWVSFPQAPAVAELRACAVTELELAPFLFVLSCSPPARRDAALHGRPVGVEADHLELARDYSVREVVPSRSVPVLCSEVRLTVTQ